MCGDSEVKKIRFVCSPELADGQSCQVVDTPEQLAEVVLNWAKEMWMTADGESCNITTKFMTAAEIKELPEL